MTYGWLVGRSSHPQQSSVGLGLVMPPIPGDSVIEPIRAGWFWGLHNGFTTHINHLRNIKEYIYIYAQVNIIFIIYII